MKIDRSALLLQMNAS